MRAAATATTIGRRGPCASAKVHHTGTGRPSACDDRNASASVRWRFLRDNMKDKVAVIGVGCTKFGDLFESGYEDLICEAAFQAYTDAKIDPKDIQAAYLGTYMPGPSGGKAAVSLGDALRLYDRPITRVENYCATGTDA